VLTLARFSLGASLACPLGKLCQLKKQKIKTCVFFEKSIAGNAIVLLCFCCFCCLCWCIVVPYTRMIQIATHNFIKYVHKEFHIPAPAILGRFEKNGNTQCTEALIKKSAVVDSGAKILENLLAGQTSASRVYVLNCTALPKKKQHYRGINCMTEEICCGAIALKIFYVCTIRMY